MKSSIDYSIVGRVLDLALAIQQIPAPTFFEAHRAEFIKQLFQAEGLSDVSTDQVGNVLGRLPGGAVRRPLIVSAHMDTVFPLDTSLEFTRTDDLITAPGIGDNSVGVASLLGLLWGLRYTQPNVKLPGDIWLIANVGEEGLGNLYGMRSVVDRFGEQPLAYIILEGMGLGQVYHRGLAVDRYRVSVHTPGGHSWDDYGRPSAIVELAKIITTITNYSLPIKPRTTLNVGVINGGTTINTIASNAHLELDLRSENPSTLAKWVNKVESCVKLSNIPDVNVTMEQIGHRPGGRIPSTHPLVQLARRRLTAHGIKPLSEIGSTDANLPLSKMLPAICIGLTHGGGAHTTHEYIQTRPLQQGLSVLVDLVMNAFLEL